MFRKLKTALELYGLIGAVVVSTGVVIAGATWLVLKLNDRDVGAWVPIVLGAFVLVGVPAGYWLGRRRRRALPPEKGAAAVAELEVANNYLKHTRDFMEGLRLSAIGLPPAEAIPRLQQLRELVFDAIIQGINKGPGEHIRCALFEPVTEGAETVLRVRSHRGHTHRVERLELHMTSIAGTAFTSRETVYIPDAENDPRTERTTAGRVVKTLYCLPLYTFRAGQQAPVGVFSVASNRADAFSESDRAFISACADMIGIVEFFVHIWEEQRNAPAAAPPPPAAAAPPAAAPPAVRGPPAALDAIPAEGGDA